MSKNTMTITTKRVDILALLCASASELLSETEPDSMRLSADGITVYKGKAEDSEQALVVECGHERIVLNDEAAVVELLTLLAKAEALLDIDAGGPFHTFSGLLNTAHFSVSWDAEFNVKVVQNDG